MPDDYPSVSVRLSPELMKALDDLARRQKRSRSAIVKEVLQKHLLEDYDAPAKRKERLEGLMKFAGIGAELSTYKSAEEVDATIRYLRGDD